MTTPLQPRYTPGELRAYMNGCLTTLRLIRKGLEALPIVDRGRAFKVVDSLRLGIERAVMEAKLRNEKETAGR